MDETHKTCRIEHVDIIENYVKKTSDRTRPYIPPSDTPTERVTYHDLIAAADVRASERVYFEAYRAESERLSRLKGVSLALTLREIAGY